EALLRNVASAAGQSSSAGASGVGSVQPDPPGVAGGTLDPGMGVAPVVQQASRGPSCQLGGRGGSGVLWVLLGLVLLRFARR
ncbi:MAG TPA: hypothetical protein VJR89_01800, partial [Polyangiales bacterium]|nr:hypothetical protein [Polyangiales bacterium]